MSILNTVESIELDSIPSIKLLDGYNYDINVQSDKYGPEFERLAGLCISKFELNNNNIDIIVDTIFAVNRPELTSEIFTLLHSGIKNIVITLFTETGSKIMNMQFKVSNNVSMQFDLKNNYSDGKYKLTYEVIDTTFSY